MKTRGRVEAGMEWKSNGREISMRLLNNDYNFIKLKLEVLYSKKKK